MPSSDKSNKAEPAYYLHGTFRVFSMDDFDRTRQFANGLQVPEPAKPPKWNREDIAKMKRLVAKAFSPVQERQTPNFLLSPSED